jgi:N-acetylmuramoyl-L-alanine amidase
VLTLALIFAMAAVACGGGDSRETVLIEPAGTGTAAAGPAGDARTTVFIDAGHGGRDPGWGSSFILDGVAEEKDLTLDLAKRTAAALEAAGIRAVLSRTTDTDVNEPERDVNGDGVLDIVDELQLRADAANSAGAAVLLSVHFNGMPGTQLGGAGVYYNPKRDFSAENKRLAQLVQDEQLAALDSMGYTARDWGALPEDAFETPTQSKLDTGYKFNTLIGPAGPFRTRPSMMPAAIAEPLFLTNPAEAALAQRDDVREALAQAYARAIKQFLGPQHGGVAPAPTGPAVAMDRGQGSGKVVALTFDAGAETGQTAAILDVLKRKGVRASFGLTGAWAEANPALARRIAVEGHTVINHSYSHASWTGKSPGTKPLTLDQRRAEIERAEASLQRATGVTGRPFFRSPYGDRDEGVQRDLGALGYRYNVLWSFDSKAWHGERAAAIVQNGLRAAAPGAIFIFHVAEQQDALALEPLIDGLSAAGYGFVTVAQLLDGDSPQVTLRTAAP